MQIRIHIALFLIHALPCKALRRYIGHQNICARKR